MNNVSIEGISSQPKDSLDEFGLISKFFVHYPKATKSWRSQGVGDDCAFLEIGSTRIAVTADMMSIGTHFLENADPFYVGRKVLAVNLSDLAAAGAEPEAFFLSIALPKVDEKWLARFSSGLKQISEEFDCPLRGGDTTKAASVEGRPGKTVFSVCALGSLPSGKGLTRKGAQVDDDIWVTGSPGDAFAALGAEWGYWNLTPNQKKYFASRMNDPTPRIHLGRDLLDVATSCCDISDGLAGDLKHILARSMVSAELFYSDFPRSLYMKELDERVQRRCILNGGDDYELIFTAPPGSRNLVIEIGKKNNCPVTRIGKIVSKEIPFSVKDRLGSPINCGESFNHFS